MQTSTRTPQKLYQKYFPEVFVNNEMYLMAGESLSKSDYQKKCQIQDSRQ